jgi:hypothetical protein
MLLPDAGEPAMDGSVAGDDGAVVANAKDAGDAAGGNPGSDADAHGEASVTTPADAGDGGASKMYSTNFDGTEKPISENGAWVHLGLDWAYVDTGNGLAYGTQTGTGGYNDSYAHLSGFPPDQSGSGVIHKDAALDGSTTHEVEIHLHWSDAAHDAHGYECNLAFDGSYAQIVRWNGALGDFTYLSSGSVPGGVHEGDVLSASIVGTHITLAVNGATITTADDATWKTGNPGFGLWRGGPAGAFNGDYAFTSYTAKSIP